LNLIKRYWFLIALLTVFGVTVADSTGSISGFGRWLKAQHGPDVIILLIFLSSGMTIDARQIRSGLKDLTGTVAALVVIFAIAPIAAIFFKLLPLETGVLIGIFLVAAMPTTLSSGVVMTGASGGNMAHALFITIIANAIAVFSIPLTLSLMVPLIGDTTSITIDRAAIFVKLSLFVLLPLSVGIGIKQLFKSSLNRLARYLPILNQCLIVTIVWMGISQTRDAIIQGGGSIVYIVLISMVFHGLLLAAAFGMTRGCRIGRGRRESVIFMGAQKTLPLSIILQVTVFPQYGQALVFCVVHHVVHLMMDSYLVVRLKE
jgi:solute carrier family 10 (sodium/bile acid cotransporter), member 7